MKIEKFRNRIFDVERSAFFDFSEFFLKGNTLYKGLPICTYLRYDEQDEDYIFEDEDIFAVSTGKEPPQEHYQLEVIAKTRKYCENGKGIIYLGHPAGKGNSPIKYIDFLLQLKKTNEFYGGIFVTLEGVQDFVNDHVFWTPNSKNIPKPLDLEKGTFVYPNPTYNFTIVREINDDVLLYLFDYFLCMNEYELNKGLTKTRAIKRIVENS